MPADTTARKDHWRVSCAACSATAIVFDSVIAYEWVKVHPCQPPRVQGCRCGNCDYETVSNFRGETIAWFGVGRCFEKKPEIRVNHPTADPYEVARETLMRIARDAEPRARGMMSRNIIDQRGRVLGHFDERGMPRVGPQGPAGNSGANGNYREPRAMARGGWTAPSDVVVKQPEQEVVAEVWRSRWFGWNGELRVGWRTICRWWRPLRRYAEYRASYVKLREIEARERVRI